MNDIEILHQITAGIPVLGDYLRKINKEYNFEDSCINQNPLVALIRLRNRKTLDKDDLSLFLAEELLKSKIEKLDVFDNGTSVMNLLHFSCLHIKDTQMCKLILEYCPEQINMLTKCKQPESPLAYALGQNAYEHNGPHPILKRLLKSGANIHEDITKKALWKAYTSHGQVKHLRKWNEWIISNGIDPYMKYQHGETIFHHMASGKELDPLLDMWKKGFLNIDIEANTGQTVRKLLTSTSNKQKAFFQNYIKLEKESLNKDINKKISTSKINRI